MTSRDNTSGGKVRFITPPNTLKQKVGSGGISEDRMIKSQQFMDNVDVDFAPYADQFLKQLASNVETVKSGNDNYADVKDALVSPIMQLKANGGLFRYDLVSHLADIALNFLETIDDLNDDAIKVLKAHENTIKIIVNNKLTGHGGKEGDALVKELDGACKRYFSKHKE